MILGLPKSHLFSNGFAAECHELALLFFPLFLSIPEICLAKVIARYVLPSHEGIMHILHVGYCNWAIFLQSCCLRMLKTKYEMQKELISYQYSTKYAADGSVRRLLA